MPDPTPQNEPSKRPFEEIINAYDQNLIEYYEYYYKQSIKINQPEDIETIGFSLIPSDLSIDERNKWIADFEQKLNEYEERLKNNWLQNQIPINNASNNFERYKRNILKFVLDKGKQGEDVDIDALAETHKQTDNVFNLRLFVRAKQIIGNYLTNGIPPTPSDTGPLNQQL